MKPYRVRMLELDVEATMRVMEGLQQVTGKNFLDALKSVASGTPRNDWLLANAQRFESETQTLSMAPDSRYDRLLYVLYAFIDDERVLVEYRLRYGR